MNHLSDIVDHEFNLISVYSQEEYDSLTAARRPATSEPHGTLASRLEQTTPLANASSYDIAQESTALTDPPTAYSSLGDMPSQNPVDSEDIVMFDHDTPPAGVPVMVSGDYSLMDENARAQLWMPIARQESPLFAEPTPGPGPVPSSRASANTSANTPVENRDLRVPLDARRVFACNFPGCGRSLTRVSDLRRHWRTVHRGHRQT